MVKVEIYGIIDGYSSKDGGCGSPIGCNINLTIGEQIKKLQALVKEIRLLDKAKITFISLDDKVSMKNRKVQKMLKDGFSMPFVFINDQLRFFGAIPEKAIVEEVINIVNSEE